jgi:hypothetical protein
MPQICDMGQTALLPFRRKGSKERKYPGFFIGEQSEERYMAYVLYLKNYRADRGKLVPFLKSAGQIYSETGLTLEAPKCVLASEMSERKINS